ncbi:MAG: trimeric intracellular cation channel family protein [Cocleimonas sp.]|nr:trimeric intracellular cation channel family protein [Cocleimonas sp.]
MLWQSLVTHKDMISISPTPELLESLYWITLLAVIVSSASAVLKAGFKEYDLFGVIIIAVSTGLGGGSLRDMLLDRDVFWIQDQIFFIASLGSAVVVFITARLFVISPRFFLIPDAAGLATFGIAGTLVALMLGTPLLVASFMGVMTGIMGGIFRDILCNEPPLVFSSPLYATVSWLGSLFFILLLHLNISTSLAAIISGLVIFIARLLALKYDINLPRFRFKK